MSWLVFALLAGGFYTAQGLLSRYVLKEGKDAWAFSFYFSFIGALVSFPVMLINPQLPSLSNWWLLVLLMGILVVIHNYLVFRSVNYLSASFNGIISKLRLVWLLLIGSLFLGEAFTFYKVVGTVITIVASLVIIRKFNKPESFRGVVLAIGSTLVYAGIVTCVKMLFTVFNASTLTFFIFLIPAVINYIVMPRATARIKTLFQEDGKFVAMACALGAFANLALNQAYALGEVSRVAVATEAFLVVTIAGEHLYLQEKDHLFAKIVAVVLAIVGVVLINL